MIWHDKLKNKKSLFSQRIIIILLIALALLSGYVYLDGNLSSVLPPSPAETTSPFTQFKLIVNDRKDNAKIMMNERAEYYARVGIKDAPLTPIRPFKNTLQFALQEDTKSRVVNKLELLKKINKKIVPYCEIEIAKESPEYLKTIYNFTTETGYLIIGRNTCELSRIKSSEYKKEYIDIKRPKEEKFKILELLRKCRTDAIEILTEKKNDRKTILSKATLITQFVWSLYSTTGPCDLITPNLSTYEVLTTIQKEGGTVQCTGTRDLFIDIAYLADTGLKIRKVDAFRYYPFIPNIVVNSHSVLEIKLPNNEWFLFDPFVRVYFENKENILLSSNDIKELLFNKQLDKIIPKHVLTRHEKREDFSLEKNPYDPYNWNYFTHFNYIHYTLLSPER